MSHEILVIIQNHYQYIICTNHLPGFMYLPQVQKYKEIQTEDCLVMILNNERAQAT